MTESSIEPEAPVATSEPAALPESFRLTRCEPECDRRGEAELFVRTCYRRAHGAHVASFLPTLLVMSDSEGAIRGVCGYRTGTTGSFFLERYLDAPLEHLLSQSVARSVERNRLVEVGNLACDSAHIAAMLVAHLTAHLLDAQMLWAGFTATASVRRVLHLMGARAIDLGAAEASRAGDGPDDWGRYYSHRPRVMAGYLPRARRLPAFWSVRRAN